MRRIWRGEPGGDDGGHGRQCQNLIDRDYIFGCQFKLLGTRVEQDERRTIDLVNRLIAFSTTRSVDLVRKGDITTVNFSRVDSDDWT